MQRNHYLFQCKGGHTPTPFSYAVLYPMIHKKEIDLHYVDLNQAIFKMCTFRIEVMLSHAEEAFPRSVLEVLLGIIGSSSSNMVLNLSQTLIYIIWRNIYYMEINNVKFV